MTVNVLCMYCLREIEPSRAYRRVIGWERRREGGGTNALRGRRPTNDFACTRCIDRIVLGLPPVETPESEVV